MWPAFCPAAKSHIQTWAPGSCNWVSSKMQPKRKDISNNNPIMVAWLPQHAQRQWRRRKQPHTYLHRSAVLKPLSKAKPAVRNQRKLFLFFVFPPCPLSPLPLSPVRPQGCCAETVILVALWEVSILLFWQCGRGGERRGEEGAVGRRRRQRSGAWPRAGHSISNQAMEPEWTVLGWHLVVWLLHCELDQLHSCSISVVLNFFWVSTPPYALLLKAPLHTTPLPLSVQPNSIPLTIYT